MTRYVAPVQDMQFVLHDVLKLSQSGLPGHDELDRDFTAAILDAAGQKGTGRWTVKEALDLGVPTTGIGEAVFARALVEAHCHHGARGRF